MTLGCNPAVYTYLWLQRPHSPKTKYDTIPSFVNLLGKLPWDPLIDHLDYNSEIFSFEFNYLRKKTPNAYSDNTEEIIFIINKGFSYSGIRLLTIINAITYIL